MRHFLVALVALAAVGCGDTYNVAAPTAPTAPVVIPRHTIEFRVTGNATSARIRYSNPAEGLTQTVSSLPFLADTATAQPLIFLSLDVTPIAYPFIIGAPFMSAQIIVDGFLFREATSNDTTLSTISASGTWRAN